ncbi:MAG: hypothetical protein EOM20_10455, partial [Spartobacteria bacterium]|nr:hypothetical protein [Spartobacteria bacterium]
MKNIIKTAYLSLSMLTVISHADMQLNNLHISAVPQSVTASATNAIPYITVNGTNYGQAAPLTFEGNAVTATGDVINISEIDPEFTRAQDEGYAYLYATNI